MMKKATPQQTVAVTSVFWDIKTCPVPSYYDACLVGPCIRRFLKKLGYSGPLTIIVVGLLSDVPVDVLRAFSSTGIVLNHVPSDSLGILKTMYYWTRSYPPPANMMLISSNPSIFPQIHRRRHSWGYNIFQLFPYDSPNAESLWKDFLLEDAGALNHCKCSGTGESAYWMCSACADPLCQGFDNFTTHLSSREHQRMVTRMDKAAVAVTAVFWDIKWCPVPPDCDPRWVGPCIRQHLEDFGYSGPLTIYAIGTLTDIPEDILRAVSSTGIVLNHFILKCEDITDVMYPWAIEHRCPANMMVICPNSMLSAKTFGDLRGSGFNVIEPFPFYSESLWREFLLEYSETLEEDKCSETGEHASWVCSVCHGIPGKGLENFTRHLKTPDHELMMSGWISDKDEKDEEAVKAGDDSLPDYATTMVLR